MKEGTRKAVNFSGAVTHGSLARLCIITDPTLMKWMNTFVEASGETGSTVLEVAKFVHARVTQTLMPELCTENSIELVGSGGGSKLDEVEEVISRVEAGGAVKPNIGIVKILTMDREAGEHGIVLRADSLGGEQSLRYLGTVIHFDTVRVTIGKGHSVIAIANAQHLFN
jgi:hypothetical protein